MNVSIEELRELTQPQPVSKARTESVPIGFRIAVLDRGWVISGHCVRNGEMLHITSAKCIRRWGTTTGLGEIAESGPTSKTVLDTMGTVEVSFDAVKFLIVCKSEF